ncbi:hypothetical protein Egran_01833, partial [Elaphomyces granulatus]
SSETGSSSQLEPSLQHFLDPSFDPAEFLNDALPPLTLATSQPHASKTPGAVPLADVSTRSQSVLSQLTAQNLRLSNILTQLTDEILRSGGRLAYDVEILRGETIGLWETLTESSHVDIGRFLPMVLDERTTDTDVTSEGMESHEKEEDPQKGALEPPFITQLRTLSQVRARLEQVVHTFGEAMEWPLPPSEVSFASSFISVSAPEPGPDHHSREEKGEEVANKLRAEIADLLDGDDGSEAGLEAATRRVEALRRLASVWKGTVEEKARNRFVDSLAKTVEDRRRILDSQSKDREQRRDRSERSPRRLSSRKSRPSIDHHTVEDRSKGDGGGPGGSTGGGGGGGGGSGGGLLRNLQRLRDEIYLD